MLLNTGKDCKTAGYDWDKILLARANEDALAELRRYENDHPSKTDRSLIALVSIIFVFMLLLGVLACSINIDMND